VADHDEVAASWEMTGMPKGNEHLPGGRGTLTTITPETPIVGDEKRDNSGRQL